MAIDFGDLKVYERMTQDPRFEDAYQGCLSCGTCESLCPAGQFYDYNPREVVEATGRADEAELRNWLENKIWYCAQCCSCKFRCPRGNSAADLVMILRDIAVEKGWAKEALEKYTRILKTILTVGNQLSPDMIAPDFFPDWGPRVAEMSKHKKEWRAELGIPGLMPIDRSWAVPAHVIKELLDIWKLSGAMDRVEATNPFLVELAWDNIEEALEDEKQAAEASHT
ncbi:MAG: 4Fe-4S dicluster domain-containing protein [Thermaerobacter sp.]|jgi:heterodisulfide reductase subunit C|nr:4Fe-4S dicluster domain-containing protein [Thermaerobacter sp.]MDA8146634.1 4Fe-4S dicluster domain-containing protein [Thermaerobacter sp.]